MKWIEVKVVFDAEDNHLAGELITNLFFESDFKGVVEEDPAIKPNEAWAEDAIGRPAQHAVRGYFPKDQQALKNCRDLEEKLSLLNKNFSILYRIHFKELDEEDWAEAWKAFFKPQKIGRQIVVKPTWCSYTPESGDIVLELDPGMAFGTGTHPTTALCVRLIEKHLNSGDSFLDLGTGSGILMIAAAKLGAGFICGLDKDPVAVDVAASNLKRNGLDSRHFVLHTGNLLTRITDTYDFIVANIFTHVILELLDDLPRALAPDGIFVCSGICEGNKKLVVARLKNMGFDLLEVCEHEEWAAIASRFHS
ncbi:MAG: 50S ribosomal protein L11 methyltransferase [Desulfobacterales bacterium]|nr:50S ribosomal protein L11 methyltransferase [Desulfobacterales bacterium]